MVREQGCTNTSPGCGYNDNCEDKDSITKKWACGKDRTGKWKKYFGRGAKQLSYNFNYGQFSQAMFGDRRLLLDYPDFVADTWLNLASATWFYTTPQPPKPSMLHVIDSTWVPNQEDKRNGISPGFGATINIINGGLECNTKDGRESRQALNRILSINMGTRPSSAQILDWASLQLRYASLDVQNMLLANLTSTNQF